jgi:ABC-2 type transport system ATP-binding protein
VGTLESTDIPQMISSLGIRVVAAALDANFFTDDRTIIISTHQVKDVESLVDHVTVLDEGRVLFDHTMQDISAKLALTKTPSDNDKIFYDEDIVGGKMYLVENVSNKDSNIDLEILFNGIITNPREINTIFEQKA